MLAHHGVVTEERRFSLVHVTWAVLHSRSSRNFEGILANADGAPNIPDPPLCWSLFPAARITGRVCLGPVSLPLGGTDSESVEPDFLPIVRLPFSIPKIIRRT